VQVEEELIALNVGICEVMLQLIVPPPSLGNEKNIKNDQHHVTLATLEYFESALYGMVYFLATLIFSLTLFYNFFNTLSQSPR